MKPIELYRFVQGSTVWTFTSADSAVVYNFETYVPIPIGRTSIEVKNELSKANIEIKLPLMHAIAQQWLSNCSEPPISLTLFQQLELDTSTIWKGRCAGVKPDDEATSFLFESIFTLMRRPGLRARYTRTCRHALYRGGCGVNKDTYAETFTATLGVGNTISVTGLPADITKFYAGMVKLPNGIFRFIVGQSSVTITLSKADLLFNALLATGPQTVTLYPGCNRSLDDCTNKFANFIRFGGFPYFPKKNPFDGSAIT